MGSAGRRAAEKAPQRGVAVTGGFSGCRSWLCQAGAASDGGRQVGARHPRRAEMGMAHARRSGRAMGAKLPRHLAGRSAKNE